MKTKNLTPFPFGAKATSRLPPKPEMTLVLRACFLLAPGEPLTPPPGPKLGSQGPMTAETYRDDDEERTGECLYPGDFADWKPRADVLLRGTCYTPLGKPLAECPARFAVGGWSKILRIVGPRVWSDDMPGAKMSEPLPFKKMPIDWAHAFGGPGYARNPVGRGGTTRELSNVEHAGVIVRSRRDDPGPAGFGPINPSWPQRAAKIGKEYGRRWRKERAPYYSEDFDWGYFNAAPPDQQIEEYLRGDEKLVFQNLHPTESVFEAKLPGLRVRAFVNDVKRRFREVRMQLDTLFADLDAGKLYLTWRGITAVEQEDLGDVQTVIVASEPLADEPLSDAHYRGVLEGFEADPLGIKERFPGEMLEALEAMKKSAAAPTPALPKPSGGAALDPLSTLWKNQLAAMPGPLPGAPGLDGRIASAIGRSVASAPPEVDMPGQLARAANDAAKPKGASGANAFPLRAGGPAPSGLSGALRKALDQARGESERLRKVALPGAAGDEAKREADEIDELVEQFEKEPFLAAALDRPPPQEPGPGKDLSRQDYAGRDLRGRDLRGANLKHANLAGADLTEAKLEGANLECAIVGDATLAFADLTGANLTLANLSGVTANGAVFRDATLNRTFFQRADLTKAVFAGAKGELPFFPNAKLPFVDARKASFTRAFLKGADLTEADFSDATLLRCLFLGVEGRRARFVKALLTGTSFAKSNMPEAVFTGARGDRSIWLGAKLRQADFTRALLPRAQFMDATAPEARFFRAVLKESRCYRAMFERADFGEAQLFGIDFSKCALSGARFVGANLYDAKFKGAAGAGCDFTKANIKRSTLEDA